jgi:hypothetical protein
MVRGDGRARSRATVSFKTTVKGNTRQIINVESLGVLKIERA